MIWFWNTSCLTMKSCRFPFAGIDGYQFLSPKRPGCKTETKGSDLNSRVSQINTHAFTLENNKQDWNWLLTLNFQIKRSPYRCASFFINTHTFIFSSIFFLDIFNDKFLAKALLSFPWRHVFTFSPPAHSRCRTKKKIHRNRLTREFLSSNNVLQITRMKFNSHLPENIHVILLVSPLRAFWWVGEWYKIDGAILLTTSVEKEKHILFSMIHMGTWCRATIKWFFFYLLWPHIYVPR